MKRDVIQINEGILKFLKSKLKNHSGFPSRSFYGESFTLLLMNQLNHNDDELIKVLLDEYDKKDQVNSQFHFEFNNYAFTNLLLKTPTNQEILKRLYPLKFKNTSCTNWTLLRCNTKIRAGEDVENAIKDSKLKIKKFQLKSGLILDDPGVKSFQYHCFSMGMIAEIFFLTNIKFYLQSFLKGVDFIRKFILPNGQALYVGRGQEQSFGYGALVYILSIYYFLTKKDEVLIDIHVVLNFIKKHKHKDGSFPLVMNSSKIKNESNVDLNNSDFAGWYQYNNYYDYLPFMAVFLMKSVQYLPDSIEEIKQIKRVSDYRDNDFIIKVEKKSILIFSRPGGYTSNDLSIPLIFKSNKLLTPIYGGDHFFKGKFTVASPLPYFPQLNKSLNWRSKSIFLGDSLIVFSPLGFLYRKFHIYENQLIINSYMFSIFKIYQLFFNTDYGIHLKSNSIVYEYEKKVFSPLGVLRGNYTIGFNQQLKIELNE